MPYSGGSSVVIKVAWFYSGRLRPRVLRIKNKFCTLSLLSQIQNTFDFLFRLSWRGFNSSNLFVFGKIRITNSSESWRLIQGAEAARRISFNYLKFMFIHIIQIKGLWICDIHFLRELETRVWLKYAVHPGPGSKQKFHAIYDVFHEKSVELRLQFLTGLIYKGVIRVKGWTLSMFREDFVLWLRLRASCISRLCAFLVAGWVWSLWIRLKLSTLLLWFNPNTSQLCFVYIFFFFCFSFLSWPEGMI